LIKHKNISKQYFGYIKIWGLTFCYLSKLMIKHELCLKHYFACFVYLFPCPHVIDPIAFYKCIILFPPFFLTFYSRSKLPLLQNLWNKNEQLCSSSNNVIVMISKLNMFLPIFWPINFVDLKSILMKQALSLPIFPIAITKLFYYIY
jgi:hypothetical protein